MADFGVALFICTGSKDEAVVVLLLCSYCLALKALGVNPMFCFLDFGQSDAVHFFIEIWCTVMISTVQYL